MIVSYNMIVVARTFSMSIVRQIWEYVLIHGCKAITITIDEISDPQTYQKLTRHHLEIVVKCY